MAGFESLLPHAAPFVAVVSRFAGLFIFAPVLGSPAIPRQVKALLAIAMAASVYPMLPPASLPPAEVTLAELAPIAVAETMIGFCIGLIASIPVVSVQLGGLLMGQQMGLGFAAIYNPATETEGDVVGQILLYAALGAFLSMDGLEVMHLALMNTFERVPIGGFDYAQAPIELVGALVAGGFELALRVAAPVLCLIMAETIVMGFLMKTVPQLNIMTLGFPIKVVVGLAGLVASIIGINAAMHADVSGVIDLILDWSAALSSAGGGA